jgi:hypothetical protein
MLKSAATALAGIILGIPALLRVSMRNGALACIVGCCAVMAASPARADECNGSGEDRMCLHRMAPDPHYIQFYVTIARGAYSHFNVRQGSTQWQVPAVGGKSNKSRGTKVRIRAGNEQTVSAQACIRGSFSAFPSICSPWVVFTIDTSAGQASPASKSGWMAIATDNKGRWGWAWDAPSETGARTQAIGECGPACKVTNSAQNRCLAIAEGPSSSWGTSIGPTLPYVTTHALQGCRKNANTCTIKHSVCS